LTLSQNILILCREDGKEKEPANLRRRVPAEKGRAASLPFFVSLGLGAALNP